MTRPLRSLGRLLAACALLATLSAQAEISFTGLDEAQEANARALMKLADADCDLAQWRLDRLFRDSERELTRALQALGYYDFSVSSTLDRNEQCWRAGFDVQLGPPVRLREVEVLITGEASSDAAFNALDLDDRPLEGEILHHGRYSDYKNQILASAHARGYFDARFERSEVLVDPDAHAADLHIHLVSGSRYRFGEVSFTKGIIRESLLRNYSDVRTGDPYDAEAVNELLVGLNGSGYFDYVSISTEPLDRTAKTAPVSVELGPGPRRIYSIGLGYATDTGPQGRFDFANRRVNQRGHQIESRMFGSEVESELSASYRWPKRDPRKVWYSLVAGLQREETDTSDSDSFKLGLRRSFQKPDSWLETRYVEYVAEDFRIGDQGRSSELVIFGSNWDLTRGREVSRTLNGWRFNLDLRAASDSLGSDTSFLQAKVTGKWIHSFNDRTRLLARARVGTTLKDELALLPASVRFFAGGDRSVRGYGFENLGPLDANGDVIGGSHLLETSIEIERLVRDQWAVAAFVDRGSAFSGSDPDFSTGVGLGLRWFSPVGPVRLDLAHPLDDADRNLRIHISLGLDL